MSTRPAVLITGAGRGLGLGLAREMASRGWTVFAGSRRPAGLVREDTHGSEGSIFPVQIDVVDDRSVRAAAGVVSQRCSALDVLINNAGVNPEPRDVGVERVTPAAVLETFDVNTVGAIRVTQAFLPLLRCSAGARVVNITSGAGSLTKNPSRRPQLPYCLSKAALNLLTRRVAEELEPQGIVVVSVSPGWVRTDMGGEAATLSIVESAAALVTTIESLVPEQSGQWLDRFGQPSEFAW